MNPHADLLIVTATKTESKAVFDVFQNFTGFTPQPIPIGDRVFHNLGTINGANIYLVQS